MNLADLVRQARSLGLAAEPERPSHADAGFYDQYGYQYGLLYADGYIATEWSGPNQLLQVLQYRAQLAEKFHLEYVLSTTIVRRRNTTDPWLDARINQVFRT